MQIIPHRYQIRAVQHLLKHPFSALFLDLGLGKTVVTATAGSNLLQLNEIKGLLILAPLRVVYNVWPNELEKWDHLQHLTYTILHGSNKDKRLKEKHDIYLINYEGIAWLHSKLTRMQRYEFPFDMVVYDESTAVKSHSTQRFKKLRTLIRLFKRRVILTGTPAPNSLLDLWSQYYLLDEGERLGKSQYSFKTKYFFQADYHGYDWQPYPNSAADIGESVSDITMRLKAQDYLEMPDLIHNRIVWSMSPAVESKYKEFEKHYIASIRDETVTAVNAASLSGKLRQFVSGFVYNENKEAVSAHNEKIKVLEEIVDGSPAENILVAIQFRHEYELIKAKFPKAPVIYGGMSQNKTKELIIRWNKCDLPLLVVHPASIAHGVNLQEGGRMLVWFGIPWSYEHYGQMLGRLHRQGQQKPVLNNFILAKNSVEERVVEALEKKGQTEASFLKSLIKELRGADGQKGTKSRDIFNQKNKRVRRAMLQVEGSRYKRSA